MKNESAELHLDAQLQARLERCTNLPSPPVVALRVIELAQDPDVDIGMVSDVISTDPALAAKVLRVANSPIYALRRKTETLHQAITLLGLNGTLMLALSFSLASSMHNNADQGFDYIHFWKRSLASATCARRLGVIIKLRAKEELFLASLLQDIGMLVIDKMDPKFYLGLGVDQHHHAAVAACECERLGADHAAIGGWILRKWGFPEYLFDAVVYSHSAESSCEAKDFLKLMHCVSLSGLVVDAIQNPTEHNNLQVIAGLANERLGISEGLFSEMLALLNNDFAEAQEMFDTDLSDYNYSDILMDNAREMLMMMNLQTLQQADKLQESAEVLESRTRELEERSRRDGLTGLYNRAFLDQKLSHEFSMANDRDWPMIVMFVDLDHFKKVNDTYGHQAGDQVLQQAARALAKGTRDDDIVARYGGEEFVIVTPGRGESTAHVMAERLVNSFRSLTHTVNDGKQINVTVSIGLSILGEGVSFSSVDEMVDAADKALYVAKKNGRNRYIIYSKNMGNDSGMQNAAAPAA